MEMKGSRNVYGHDYDVDNNNNNNKTRPPILMFSMSEEANETVLSFGTRIGVVYICIVYIHTHIYFRTK